MQDHIYVKGARENNLKNVDVTIPRDKLVVLTGLSGSGKSSLAFDTIYAEGQRRYVESLSSYGMWSPSAPTPGCSWGRWRSPTWTTSTACPPPSPSTRRPPAKTPGPPWAR